MFFLQVDLKQCVLAWVVTSHTQFREVFGSNINDWPFYILYKLDPSEKRAEWLKEFGVLE